MKINHILRYLGVSLLMVAALMLVSGMISMYYDRDESTMPLFFSALLTGIVGLFPLIFTPKSDKLSAKEGYFVVTGVWLLGCFFGMLPFLMYGGEFSFANALFEAVSGFTASGASILNDIEALPRGLLFWRMATSWVGGIGIVTLFSMFIPHVEEKSVLTGVEISEMAGEDGNVSKRLFANRMLVVYVVLTVVTILCLKLAGLGWFDAVANAMSVCSTCGFCTRNLSVAAFDSPAVESIMMLAMFTSGLNFSLIFISFLRGRHGRLFASETVRFYVGMILISTLIVTVSLSVSHCYESFWTALRKAIFTIVSISTTSGFAVADTTVWPPLCILIIIICSLICGCSGSTSGGIKVDRALLAAKALKHRIFNLHNPRSVSFVKVNGAVRSRDTVYDVFGFIICYFAIIAFFAIVNLIFGLDLTTGVTASIACMGNVGPGFGDVGSMGNYSGFPSFLKLTCSFEMLLGRLEIFPLLYFLGFRKMK